MDKIAVLIPCYNEEQTIEKVVRDVREALPEAVIYVYDNNSTDRTAELAKAAGATEQLKASDQMKWVGLMNVCKAQAEEIILSELVYN